MKNFKYLAVLLSFTFFISCGEDDVDSITNDGTFSATTEINVGFTDMHNGSEIFEGDMLTFTIGTTTVNALPADMVVELSMTSTDGTVDEVNFPATVTIPAGATSVDVPVTFADEGTNGDTESYTMEIVNATMQSNSQEYYVTPSAVSSSIRVLSPPITTIAGDVVIRMTWVDGSRDLDLFLVTGDQDLGGTVIDDSQGVTTTEAVVFPGASADGIYSVFINQFAFTADVEYTMTFEFPDGQQIAFTRIVSQDSFVFTIDKATNGADVVYTIVEI